MNYKKIGWISIFSIFMLATIVGAVTISQMQTKLQNSPGVSNVTQINANTLQYTYSGIISKISSEYNATLGFNVTSTKIYNGTQQYNITVTNPKRIKIQLMNENLTLMP